MHLGESFLPPLRCFALNHFIVGKGSLLKWYLYTKTYNFERLRIITIFVTFTVEGFVLLETLRLYGEPRHK